MTVLKMSRIKLRRKKRKTSKLRGRRYAGYGQVSGGHRKSGQRGGFGRAGVKDHMKINLLRKGHEFGSRGFTHYGPYRPQYPINVGKIIELAKEGLINAKEEHKKLVVDLTKMRNLRILGGGSVNIPIKLLLNNSAHVTKRAEEKIKAAGGDIVIVVE